MSVLLKLEFRFNAKIKTYFTFNRFFNFKLSLRLKHILISSNGFHAF